MNYIKKILAILMVLALCAAFTACGAQPEATAGSPAQTDSVAADSRVENPSEAESTAQTTEAAAQKDDVQDDMTSKPPSDQNDDSVKPVHVGMIAWSMAMGDEAEFVQAVQSTLSEQYPDQIGEVIVMDSMAEVNQFSLILENLIVRWGDEPGTILIVNGENGFTDETLLQALVRADEAGMQVGVDHAIEGAPDNTFVYDASDAAGCASLIVDNALK